MSTVFTPKDRKNRMSHIYRLGSTSHCGCDFELPDDPILSDADEADIKKWRDNMTNLHAYVAECLGDEESVELFGCWSGDEAKPVQLRRLIRVVKLLDETFRFDSFASQLIVVSP